jgi:hypothetical protein
MLLLTKLFVERVIAIGRCVVCSATAGGTTKHQRRQRAYKARLDEHTRVSSTLLPDPLDARVKQKASTVHVPL